MLLYYQILDLIHSLKDKGDPCKCSPGQTETTWVGFGLPLCSTSPGFKKRSEIARMTQYRWFFQLQDLHCSLPNFCSSSCTVAVPLWWMDWTSNTTHAKPCHVSGRQNVDFMYFYFLLKQAAYSFPFAKGRKKNKLDFLKHKVRWWFFCSIQ